MALSSDSFEQPSVTYKVNEDLNEGVTLLCNVTLKENVSEWKNVTYEVEWLVNGISVENNTFCYPYDNEVPLNNKSCPGQISYTAAELGPSRYELGNWVSCRIRARFSTNPSNQWVKKESGKFFAGIKVEPSTINLNACSGGSKSTYNIHCGANSWLQWDTKLCEELNKADSPQFVIQPTIPIWPSLEITFRVPKGLLLDRCTLALQGTEKRFVTITPQCNSMSSTESLGPSYIVVANKTQFPVGIIKVNIHNTRIDFCSSNTDPHFWTFDGLKYNHMELGDFVFYKNERRNFEILVQLGIRTENTKSTVWKWSKDVPLVL